MEAKTDIIDVQPLPFGAGFNWSVGVLMETFIKTLADKELLATKCPKCGYTYVPPRLRCGQCCTRMEEAHLVTLSGKGTVVTSTTAHVRLDGSGNFVDLKEPEVIASVKLEGADSTVTLPIKGANPEDVSEGTAVEVKWREEAKGDLEDIEGFTLVAG